MRRRRQGFTLMELMIVVTVIGLLAMMAIPAFRKARNKTQREVCKYNQRMIFEQLNVYCLETGEPLTTIRFPNLCAARDALVPLASPLSACYIKDRRVFSCPGNANQTVQHDYRYVANTAREIIRMECNIRAAHNN